MLTAIYLLLILTPFASCKPPETLRLVQSLFRHGDKSPEYIYPKDKHQVSNTWPDGENWLTNMGKEQLLKLGSFLRDRYSGFLNTSRYNHNEIIIESSAFDRCLMSAYSALAGLFPPQQDQLWHKGLQWQPIPVRTKPYHEDNKLASSRPCPRYTQLLKEQQELPYYKQLDLQNKAFYQMIENRTGMSIKSFIGIGKLFDVLISERAHGLKRNEWAYEPGVWERIHWLKDVEFGIALNTVEMGRLAGGVLLKEIIANMRNAITQREIKPKVHMYSGHDTTIAALLRTMDINYRHTPPFAALVMVELHQVQQRYQVKILYQDGPGAELIQLVPKGCQDSCSLGSFLTITKPSVPVDWETECVKQ